jgi:predicted ATPase
LMKIAGITWKEKRMVGSAIHERYSENIYEATRRNLIQAARSFDYVKQEMVKERKLKWSNSQIWIFVLSTLDLLEKKPLRVGTQKDKEYLERLYKYVAQEFKKERGLTWSEARIRRFLGNLLGVKEMD